MIATKLARQLVPGDVVLDGPHGPLGGLILHRVHDQDFIQYARVVEVHEGTEEPVHYEGRLEQAGNVDIHDPATPVEVIDSYVGQLKSVRSEVINARPNWEKSFPTVEVVVRGYENDKPLDQRAVSYVLRAFDRVTVFEDLAALQPQPGARTRNERADA